MSEKIKAIRGSKERTKEVKQWLRDQGALMNIHTCEEPDFLYFVRDNKSVDFLPESDAFLFDVEELPLWRAKFDEEYWYIDDALDVRCTTEDYSRKHDDRYVARNYFKTEGEAEEYCDKFIKLLKERQ